MDQSLPSIEQNRWRSTKNGSISGGRGKRSDIVNPYLLEKLHIQREEEKIKEEYFRE
jgi:hypothetical protein